MLLCLFCFFSVGEGMGEGEDGPAPGVSSCLVRSYWLPAVRNRDKAPMALSWVFARAVV